MNFMPIMLNLTGRRVVIIGGGHIAHRKAKSFMPHCNNISVLSTAFSDEFSDLEVEKIQMEIGNPGELDSVVKDEDLVVIATDDHLLNDKISDYCNKRGILFNSVDNAKSPFIFPATFEEDGLIISVSTSGRSPSLTRFLRDRIGEEMSVYFSALPVAEKLRSSTEIPNLHVRARFFSDLFSRKEFWELIAAGDMNGALDLGMKISESYR